ncbi:MAG: winged helix-turn-helix domain-containing protein [Candidatus Hydrogenedentes bacterium]|nr:winged helix-turn-helix domain-containing protein [Candidatus Hydrogenedentota bacterium]
MRRFIELARALSDENRVRALIALKNRELCVCQIMAMLALAPSTVSKHMSILKQAGLVDSDKRGRWVYYRLPKRGQDEFVDRALDWTFALTAGEATPEADADRLCAILCMRPEDLYPGITIEEALADMKTCCDPSA